VGWKPEWTLALVPIGGAMVITLALGPFVIGRLIDRAR
jgi:hypothetical protein